MTDFSSKGYSSQPQSYLMEELPVVKWVLIGLEYHLIIFSPEEQWRQVCSLMIAWKDRPVRHNHTQINVQHVRGQKFYFVEVVAELRGFHAYQDYIR